VGSIASFLLTPTQNFQGLVLSSGIIIIALAHGLTIALLVAGIGPISGGHINPAVTFATVITNRISITRGAMYIVAQLLGAVVGALLLKAFIDDSLLKQIPGAGGHSLNTDAVPSQLAGMG
jgi:glycerol uptake facilitator-like aquaporin